MLILHFYGKYKKLCGAVLRLNVNTIPKAVRLLEANFKGKFASQVNADAFHITKGEVVGQGHMNLEEHHLALQWPFDTHIHLIPKSMGAAGQMKKKGLGAILLGVALIGASFLFPAALGMSGFFAGLSLVAGGASLLLTPEVGVKDDKDNKSYSFNGAQNSDEQGVVEPVIYGEVECGSVQAAASIRSTNSKKD